jgi:chromosome segregation ATPase
MDVSLYFAPPQAAIESLTSSIDALNKHQAALGGQKHAIKEAIEAVRQDIAAEEAQQAEVHDRVEQWKGRVVRSPQKVQHALGVAEAEVEREKAAVATLKQRIEETRADSKVRTSLRHFTSIFSPVSHMIVFPFPRPTPS